MARVEVAIMKLPILTPADKRWFWLWGLPVLCMLVIIAASQMGSDVIEAIIVSPFGFSENIPTVFVVFGVAYTIAIIRLPQGKHLKGWMVVYALAIIFFAGEDQNWFQYWIGAKVPDYFLAHNKEQEINLHNINSWFNQKPRLMVEIWAWVACILVPLGWWTWPKKATTKFVPAALWPDTRVIAIAAISIGVGMAGRIQKHLSHMFDLPDPGLNEAHHIMLEAFSGVRISELEEIGFAYLMLLFVALLYGRLLSKTAAKPKKPRAKKSK